MGNNVTSNGFLGISCKHGATINLGYHLISDNNCNSEFISNTLKHSQELGQMHLTSRKFTSTREISSVQSSGRVNYHECKPILSHQGCGL
jgi:hypothetical protein